MSEPEDHGPPVEETWLGPDLPTLRIGTGPRTLVYLPGLTLHPGMPAGAERGFAVSGWDSLLDRYSIYRVGRRQRPVGTTFADMAADAALAIEQLGAPVDLAGASTGGRIALELAAARPELVRRLALVITGTREVPWASRLNRKVMEDALAGRWRGVYSRVFEIGATTGVQRVISRVVGWTMGPRLVGIPADSTQLIAELTAWEAVRLETRVPPIPHPTLVIGGARDPVFPPDAMRAMAAQIPDCRLVIEPNLAHDFPARLIHDHLSPFLDGAAPATRA